LNGGVTDVATDGRVRRGARNREAIVEALVALYHGGELAPTAQQVADAAGVAPRSVYHHFADMEGLVTEVAQRQLREYGHLMDPPPVEGALHVRIAVLVDRRGQLFESVAPVRRAALLLAHRSPTIRRHLTMLGRRLRRQLEVLFAPEIRARRPRARAVLLDELDLLTSWDAWDRLRAGQRLDVAHTRAVLTDTIATLLEDRR
jgi:TetR/AcrR family transcriptional regulator, regulator of autoinduction and epiphytic fitness